MIIYAVDDERPGLTLLKTAIKKAIPNVEPLCFNDPFELLSEAKKTSPDMVLLDIEMPGMNGLELAKELNKIDRSIVIVFVTGYGQYAMDAFDVYASGYIMKPCRSEQIENVMSKIKLPDKKGKDIVIKTFGNFDISYKGKPVYFRSPKGKEMLAYLVDRNGAFVTRREMAGVLFEDDFSRNTQSHLSHVAVDMNEDLNNAGITDFFSSNNGYTVDMSKADCDLKDFLNGKTNLFMGEYMEQYSWAEYRKNEFEK